MKQWAGIEALVLVAGIVGGLELATRVYDAIDGALPGQTKTRPQTSGGVLRGQVTRVADGDTFTISSQRVRIFGINSSEWCTEAGLPHCSAHGLRKAGATIAAELGASEGQLMAIYGWTTLQQASLYTRTANRRRMSDAGMALVGDAWTGILNLPTS